MKYLLFDGSDVLGPFSVQQLQQRKGFNAHSLVCPQENCSDEAYWKPAQEYEAFSFAASDLAAGKTSAAESLSADPVQRAENLVQQVSSTVGELPQLDSLDPEALTTPVDQFVEASAAEQKEMPPSAQLETQTVGQPSPLEEYFNTMRSGDLGNILGMPDPKANSDMNLSRVLEKQFEKTDPALGKQPLQETKDPFDELTAKQAPAQETATPDEIDQQTQTQLTQALGTQQPPQPAGALEAVQETDAAQTAHTAPAQAANAAKRDIAAPAVTEPPATLEQAVSALLPSEQAAAAQSASQVPLLKEPQENEKPLSLPTQVSLPSNRASWWLSFLSVVGILLLALAAGLWLRYTGGKAAVSEGQANVSQAPASVTQTPVKPRTAAATGPAKAAAVEKKKEPVTTPVLTRSKEQQAIDIVQNHVLDATRGTVKDFLNTHHAAQLAAGYAFAWSAEPLHKQVYVVKYRLAKTRQEPIVYIFQVDTSKKKLTGALNNITLDLVGKLN